MVDLKKTSVEVTRKMEKTEYRAVIKYLHLTPSEIHEDMVRTITDNAPSYATVSTAVTETASDLSVLYSHRESIVLITLRIKLFDSPLDLRSPPSPKSQ
ncbi:uncharacterized protein LOC128250558 isoform X2 [Octopus bimaculoides]|uniref:uncharacterized protein LOC128250558 isoform X2 n=1 Tax=Octopus bimaculoides TaxID=37653 RepID=UPI0022DF48EC|nr:uncharacterized protein LOC128250558 isoform X2 [Octopus bimaculoides]